MRGRDSVYPRGKADNNGDAESWHLTSNNAWAHETSWESLVTRSVISGPGHVTHDSSSATLKPRRARTFVTQEFWYLKCHTSGCLKSEMRGGTVICISLTRCLSRQGVASEAQWGRECGERNTRKRESSKGTLAFLDGTSKVYLD